MEVMLQHSLHHELSQTSMVEVVREPLEIVWQHLPQDHLHHELFEVILGSIEEKVAFLGLVESTECNTSFSVLDPNELWVNSSL